MTKKNLGLMVIVVVALIYAGSIAWMAGTIKGINESIESYETKNEQIEKENEARKLDLFTKHEIELAMDLQADEDAEGTGTVVYLEKVNGCTHIGWDYTGRSERLFSK